MWGLVRLRQFLGRALRLYLTCVIWPIICASDLKMLCIRPTSFASDLLKLCIRPTKVFHLTYKSSASEVCIQPSVKCATDLGYVVYIYFFSWVCIRHTVQRTNSSQKLLKNHVRVGLKYRRTDRMQSKIAQVLTFLKCGLPFNIARDINVKSPDKLSISFSDYDWFINK